MDCPAGWPMFHAYEDEIRTKNRFFLNPKYEQLFFQIVNNKNNISVLSAETPLFRARAKKPAEEFIFVHELRGNKNPTSSNRASPIGIPYTYLAGDKETAIAEIRSNINQEIVVAEFHINKEKAAKGKTTILTLDYASNYSGTTEDDFSSLEICSFIVFLGHAFAQPVKYGENRELSYLPCQYFAEYCKKHDFSGIRYHSAARSSSVNENHYNYVIFNDSDLIYANANCYTISSIEYGIENHGEVHLIDDSDY